MRRPARLLETSIPDAELVFVADAAHVIEVDQPDRFFDIVGKFLGGA